MDENNNIIVCTRIHNINKNNFDNMSTKLINLIQNTPLNNKIVIAFNNSISINKLINRLNYRLNKSSTPRSIRIFNNKTLSIINTDIYIVQISYWGKFVFALNILLDCARLLNGKYILYQSLEIKDTNKIYMELIKHFNENTLCVGIKLPDHDKNLSDNNKISGSNSPWNTYAIWDISKLSLTGFPMISDIGKNAGIEEVATISLLQLINKSYEVKLIEYDDINENFWSYTDNEQNRQKIDSKRTRAADQLVKLNNINGEVEFIKISNKKPKTE
jgi:hypothetical protein